VPPTHITAQGYIVATLLTTPTNGTANWPRCTRVSRCPTVENEVRKSFNSGRLNIHRSKTKPCIMWQKKSAVAEIGKQLHSLEIWNLKKGQ